MTRTRGRGYCSVLNFDGGREQSVVSAYHSADQNDSGDSLRVDSDEEVEEGDEERDEEGDEEEDEEGEAGDSGLLDVSNGDDDDGDDGYTADVAIQLSSMRHTASQSVPPAPAPVLPTPMPVPTPMPAGLLDQYHGWDGGGEDLLGLDVTAHGGPSLTY